MKNGAGIVTSLLLALLLGTGAWSAWRYANRAGYGARLSADLDQAGRWVQGRLIVDLFAPESRWRGVLTGRCGLGSAGGCSLSFGDHGGID